MYVDTTSDSTLANFVKTYLILQQYLTGRAYNLQNFLKKKKKKLIIKKTKLFQTLKQNSIHELHTIIPHFIGEKLNVLKILWKSKAKDTFHEISKKQNNQKNDCSVSRNFVFLPGREAGRYGTVQTSSQTYFRSQNPSHSFSKESWITLTPCQLFVVV